MNQRPKKNRPAGINLKGQFVRQKARASGDRLNGLDSKRNQPLLSAVGDVFFDALKAKQKDQKQEYAQACISAHEVDPESNQATKLPTKFVKAN